MNIPDFKELKFNPMNKNFIFLLTKSKYDLIEIIDSFDEDYQFDETSKEKMTQALDEFKQIEEEKSEALKALMSTLKPRHQEVLYKRYWEEMSFQEIAAEWGCEVKAVRHTEYRAWKALRSRIEKNKKNF